MSGTMEEMLEMLKNILYWILRKLIRKCVFGMKKI